MFGAFTSFGKLGSLARAVSAAWSPLSLWPTGTEPGMWISPRTLTSEWQDYAGTTPVSVPGTVADTSNPVGLALDIRAGATVLTDPGNHMLQSTSAARPLMSARVNLLTYTEDFSNAVAWDTFRCTINANATTAPDGTLTADALISNVGATQPKVIQSKGKAVATGTTVTGSFFFKKAEYSWAYIDINDNAFHFAYFDIDAGVVGSKSSDVTATIEPAGNGFFRATITCVTTAGTMVLRNTSVASDYGTADPSGPVGTGNISHYIWGAQLNLGSTATPYQSVPGDGSTYATDFPIFQKYDGVDDGMATAAFTAGTLTSAMDCMIAVRRDSGAVVVIGVWNSTNNWFAAPDSTDSVQVCYGSCGAPTVWVDGVQLAGGTSVKRDTLAAALTIGDWHIMEFRGLDLSSWTSLNFDAYLGLTLNGARGDIMLYPSTASTEDKDAARQWLADYYGVTLP